MKIGFTGNYIILREYIKCVFPPLTEVVDSTMILISGTHDFCERREYVFKVLPEYSITTFGFRPKYLQQL